MQAQRLDTGEQLRRMERAAASDDSDEGAEADARRRRKRRRRHPTHVSHAPGSAGAAEGEAGERGEKDHLFFSLRPHDGEDAHAPMSADGAPASAALCVYGVACALHADGAAAASLRLESHLQRVDRILVDDRPATLFRA